MNAKCVAGAATTTRMVYRSVSGVYECKSEEDCDYSRSLRTRFGYPPSMRDSYIENRFGINRQGRNVGLLKVVTNILKRDEE